MLEMIKYANELGLPLPLIAIISIVAILILSKIGWQEREKYYISLASNLGNLRDSLSERMQYFIYPGSEYSDDYLESAHYKKEVEKGRVAIENLKREMNPARIFLSATVDELDSLISKEWLAEFNAISETEYLESAFNEVDNAYKKILEVAKKDLKKKKRSGSIFKL